MSDAEEVVSPDLQATIADRLSKYCDNLLDKCMVSEDDDVDGGIRRKRKRKLEKKRKKVQKKGKVLKEPVQNVAEQPANSDRQTLVVKPTDNAHESHKECNSVIVVRFQSQKRKKQTVIKQQTEEVEKPQQEQQESPEMTLNKARFDVMKFGIKGMQGDTRQTAQVDLLIRLGAKPPKNKYINYKELIEQKKKEKETENEKRILDRQMGIRVGKKRKEKEKRIQIHDGRIGDIMNPIGRFRGGMLRLNKEDIERPHFYVDHTQKQRQMEE